ncbi:hypothetical protein ACA910_010837 [Epithemia clementina (nom. ined.)]
MESTVNNESVHNLMVPETKPSVTNTYKPETDSTLIDEMNHEFRFGGVDRLYRTRVGQKSGSEELDPLALLRESTVVVVGLGGVGSWAAEALCRSGIGHLVLVDLDDICISNTNRQMHTSSSSVGKFKIDVLASRFRDISPLCHVTCIHDFVSSDNVHEILDQIQNVTQKIDDGRVRSITAVLDAIDGAKEKAALIAACTDAKIPVVTCGGAAGLLDPTKIVCDDLTRVADDKLLTACRTNLRKYHNFAPGLPFHQRTNTKTWKLPAIYSTETACDAVPVSSDSPRLQVCDSGLGTACFVTGAFGFTAAAQIVSGIAQNTLKPPRRS